MIECIPSEEERDAKKMELRMMPDSKISAALVESWSSTGVWYAHLVWNEHLRRELPWMERVQAMHLERLDD